MELNSDFSKRVVLHCAQIPWRDSPLPGVRRRMLDRLGDEVARATSVVSYAPGSAFSPHEHPGGEEFLVLEGVFQDEHGDYPEGCYVRNPPQSRHQPRSDTGCVIFVKLWQFDPADRTAVVLNPQSADAIPDANRAGVMRLPLHEDDRETVRLEQWAANTRITIDASLGAELFVLAGDALQAGDRLQAQSWLRLPPSGVTHAVTGPAGATVWIKTGHLAAATA